jgi:GR25 family glycosyltransferase involved in LPS biosynthesis
MDQVDFVCISLVNRNDRRERVTNIFHQLGIAERINWWLVNKHPRSGILGCFESHVSVWSSSEFKRPYLCIFEDDVMVSQENIIKFYELINNLDNIYHAGEEAVILNMDPQYFYQDRLGPMTGLIYGYGANCSAYICPRQYLPLITTHVIPKFGVPIDIALYKIPMLMTFMFTQEKVDSDISPELLQIFNPVPKTTYSFLLKSDYFGRAMAYTVHRYCVARTVKADIVNRRVIMPVNL